MKQVEKFLKDYKTILGLLVFLLGIVFAAGKYIGTNELSDKDITTLINDCKMQDKEIEHIKGTIESQENRINNLEQKVEQLDKHIYNVEINYYKNKQQ